MSCVVCAGVEKKERGIRGKGKSAERRALTLIDSLAAAAVILSARALAVEIGKVRNALAGAGLGDGPSNRLRIPTTGRLQLNPAYD